MKKFDSLLAFCAWCYLAGTLAALVLMYVAGDLWVLGLRDPGCRDRNASFS